MGYAATTLALEGLRADTSGVPREKSADAMLEAFLVRLEQGIAIYTDGNVSEAARRAGLTSASTLHSILESSGWPRLENRVKIENWLKAERDRADSVQPSPPVGTNVATGPAPSPDTAGKASATGDEPQGGVTMEHAVMWHIEDQLTPEERRLFARELPTIIERWKADRAAREAGTKSG